MRQPHPAEFLARGEHGGELDLRRSIRRGIEQVLVHPGTVGPVQSAVGEIAVIDRVVVVARVVVGRDQVDAFAAPDPLPAPTPKPVTRPVSEAPPPAPSLAPAGIVSTRLRPWIDIGFRPLRCVLEHERLKVEFELELFNSGSGPARAVLAEATLFNAGPAQDQQIGGFFSNPVGEGERIVMIPPLKRVALRTQVVAARDRMQAYELGGRQVFVPIIAFNALYGWTGGEGQTSASYLVGKDAKGEKLAPFRLDLGPHIFRDLGAHLLPMSVRR